MSFLESCILTILPILSLPGSIAQLVGCKTADSGVTSFSPSLAASFLEIDHEIISVVILPTSAVCWFKKDSCQFNTGKSMHTKYWLNA